MNMLKNNYTTCEFRECIDNFYRMKNSIESFLQANELEIKWVIILTHMFTQSVLVLMTKEDDGLGCRKNECKFKKIKFKIDPQLSLNQWRIENKTVYFERFFKYDIANPEKKQEYLKQLEEKNFALEENDLDKIADKLDKLLSCKQLFKKAIKKINLKDYEKFEIAFNYITHAKSCKPIRKSL